jgi:AAA family ATP:ADP antiporter
MRKIFHKLFDIREGEGLRAFLMFASIFLLIASLLILKPVRNSLFLVKFGVEKLPHVFVLVALFSALIASVYSKYSRKVRLNHLILTTLLISIACLLVFWLLLHLGYQGDWFLYAFYIWVAIFGVITGAQFWLLANYIFNAREAKRLFGFIGAGAISGGIFGGYLTNYLAPRLKTENLIFFCIGFLIICIFLLRLVWKKSARYIYGEGTFRQRKANLPETTDSPVKLILNSRHLAYLASIIGVGVVVANLVDYQFSAVASEAITETDRLTAFFGFWMSNLSIASLVIQLFLTSKIMKYLGVSASLFFLPIGLFVGAVAILVNPALWSAILIKMSDGGLKHSINKAGTELLALPIPLDVKNKAKAFIDVFIKNFAKGLGGILLIALSIGLGFTIRHISLIIIALIAVWTYLIVRVKYEYVNSFRLAIEKRTIDIEKQPLNLEDASVFNSFIKVLDGKSERQILYVLNLLEDVKNKELMPYLKKLIKHSSNEIKTCILRMALQYDELDLTIEARGLIDSNDQAVRIEAIHYLCKRSDDKTLALKAYLSHDDYRVRSSAMMCASREWKESKDFRNEIDMKGLLNGMLKGLQKKGNDETQKRFIKINAAAVIGEANNSELYPYLNVLLNDESLDVVQAAVTSIGQTRANVFVPILIAHLDTKHVRKYARESLAKYGEDIVDTLAEHLENTDEDKKKRLAVPRVLALISSQKSVNLLTKNLDQRYLLLRFQIIKALNKLRAQFSVLKFDKQVINARIIDEIEQYNRILSLWLCQNNAISSDKATGTSRGYSDPLKKARKLLIVALEERLDNNLERIFRLLGLKYPPKDMFNAYLGIKSNKTNLRANSVEFLDNILEMNLKRILIPIVETSKAGIQSINAQKLFGFTMPTESECISLILQSDDNWLKVCTLYLVATLRYNKFIDSVVKLTDAPDPMVKETAKYCLKRIRISN